VVVGGFAIIQAGYARFTDDLDLLVDAEALARWIKKLFGR
jgi:hypothetical protein